MNIASIIFDSKEQQMFDKFRDSLTKLECALQGLEDFTLNIDFKVTSPFFPDFFTSKYRDSLRLSKRVNRLRLDYSLSPGKESGEFLRCPQTLIFNCSNISQHSLSQHNRIILINQEKKTFSTPFSKITIGEKKSLFRDVFFKIEQKNVDFIVDHVKVQELKAKYQRSKDCER